MAEKVLVTGAGGRLGRALLSVLAEEKRGLMRSELDIADAAAVARVFDSLKPTVVINAAAWTDVAGAETHRDAAYRANAEGVRVLAAEAARRGIALIHYSTDYVFSGEGDSPWTETDRPAPTGVYGASKLEGERQFFASGVRGAVIRAGWLHSGERDFIAAVLNRALSGGELTVVDNQVDLNRCAGPMDGGRPAGDSGVADGCSSSLCRVGSLCLPLRLCRDRFDEGAGPACRTGRVGKGCSDSLCKRDNEADLSDARHSSAQLPSGDRRQSAFSARGKLAEGCG